MPRLTPIQAAAAVGDAHKAYRALLADVPLMARITDISHHHASFDFGQVYIIAQHTPPCYDDISAGTNKISPPPAPRDD